MNRYRLILVIISLSIYYNSNAQTFSDLINRSEILQSDNNFAEAASTLVDATIIAKSSDEYDLVRKAMQDLAGKIETQGREAKDKAIELIQRTKELENTNSALEVERAKLERAYEENKKLVAGLEDVKEILEENNLNLEKKSIIIQSQNIAAKLKDLDATQKIIKAKIALHCYQLNRATSEGETQHHDLFEALFEAYGELQLYQSDSYTIQGNDKNHPIRDLCFMDDSLYACTSTGELAVWATQNGKLNNQRLLYKQEASIRHIVPNENASEFLLVSPFYHITFDLNSTRQKNKLNLSQGITHAAFINGNHLIASGNQIYKVGQEEPTITFNSGIARLFDWDDRVGFLSKNGRVYVGSNGIVELNEIYSYEKYGGSICAIKSLKNGNSSYVSYGTNSGHIVIDCDTKQIEQKIHDSKVADIQFSYSGKWLVTTAYDGSVSIWEITKINTPYYQPFILDNFDVWVLSAVFNTTEDGLYLGMRDGTIRYIDLNSDYYAAILCETLDDSRVDSQIWQSYFGDEIIQPQSCK